MRTLNLILAFTLLTTTIYAQKPDSTATPTTTKDTSYLKVNGKEIIIIEDKDAFDTKFEEWDNDKDFSKMNVDISWNKKFDGHYGGIELGVNNYLNADMEMKVPEDAQFMELDDSKSLEFNWNIADVALPIVKNRFGLVTGLGLSWNNYKFDNKQLVLKNDGEEVYAVYDSTKNYSKNKLTSVFLNVPLMLEFQQPVGNKELWIAVGGYGGVKIGSHTKVKTNDGDKTKVRKDFHLNTLRYGLRAQVGFDSFGLYCNYSLQSLFKKDEGPELYPISLGVSLTF